MKFTKMTGIGNDYVYVNCFEEKVEDPAALAIKVSDRNFGIGSDGLILIKPSDKADFMMDIYNADGSQAMMCGNGIRCVGKYVYDHGLTDKTEIHVDTMSGVKKLDLFVEDVRDGNAGTDVKVYESTDVSACEVIGTGTVAAAVGAGSVRGVSYDKVNNNGKVVRYVTVNMDSPILEPDKVPVKLTEGYKPRTVKDIFENPSDGATGVLYASEPIGKAMNEYENVAIRMPITINDTVYYATCVSMGNPHCIIFVDDTDDFPIDTIGPLFENNRLFPNRVNTEFVQVIDRTHVRMRVWERGSGETQACGTGACATAVACVLNHKTEDEIEVELLGGTLHIHWDRECNRVFMTGPAQTCFEGEI